MGIHEVVNALSAHEPISGPDYVPWWARGAYAKKHGTTYTTESGVTVHCGDATGRKSEVKEKIERKASQQSDVDIPDLSLPELCDKYGLPHELYTTAPNGGVAAMRVRNAVRKILAA